MCVCVCVCVCLFTGVNIFEYYITDIVAAFLSFVLLFLLCVCVCVSWLMVSDFSM